MFPVALIDCDHNLLTLVAIAIKNIRDDALEQKMRVSKEKAAENRGALLDAASRLFREKGIGGVGVAEVAKEAGLTHGALYAHFSSKDALAAEAFNIGFAANMAAMAAWKGEREPTFEEYVRVLFSEGMRDKLATGCPMTASASDAGRQGEAVSASFARSFKEETRMVELALDPAVEPSRRAILAIASVAAQIGAIAVSRAVVKTDPALASTVLEAVRDTIIEAHRALHHP
ncbi:TetR/AcrR family transcriptional regulator [Acidisoma silvae]|uniref:TetR/AcrR family transcriptional regulator n=1 Tax=Acidisoma silvae TaxID=2802396 RepID=A0A964E151_9PROT|nr:TetR/AcrR family transcriptional regulator [Acidisoma silvae]MCB8877844.1 TetR/AcrR family transcriptional regulator [Acidisoma silvae]